MYGPALSASRRSAHLSNVAKVEALVAVEALWLLNLSSRNTSRLTILEASKVVRVAAAASVDELLALPIVVVIPGGGGFG